MTVGNQQSRGEPFFQFIHNFAKNRFHFSNNIHKIIFYDKIRVKLTLVYTLV
jgi:hypothetical protein